MSVARYVVIGSGLRHNGKDFPIGTPMALDSKYADPLVAISMIQPQAGALPTMPSTPKPLPATLGSVSTATGLPDQEPVMVSKTITGRIKISGPDGKAIAEKRKVGNVEALDPKFLAHCIAADYNADSFTGIADGGNVSSWPDSSGNGNHLTVVSATPPVLKSGVNGLGGKAVVRFIRASSTYLSGTISAKIPTRYPVSAIAVLRAVTVAGTHKIVSVHQAGGSGGWNLGFANGQPNTYAGQTFASVQAFIDGKSSVVGLSLDSDLKHRHVVNGNASVPGTSNQDMNGTPVTITLGAHGGFAADFADYDIARLIVFRSEMSYDQLRAMEVFLSEQYGFSRSQYFGNDYQSSTPLDIPTPDGSFNATHPDVIYGEGATIAGSGYKYLMAYTPMPEANENPCIAGSNDGDAWEVPSGVTNPLVAKPVGAGNYNSDCDMHLGPDGRICMLFREALTTNVESLKAIYSSDARTWTAPVTIIDSSGIATGMALRKLLSPAVVWDGSEYLMWSVREITSSPLLRVVDLRRSATLAGIATAALESTNLFNPAKSSGQEIWHLDVIYKDGVYYALTYVASTLELFASTDGKSWTCARTNVAYTQGSGTFASATLYRSTMQFDDDGDLTIWYAANNGTVNRIAKMTLPKIHIPQVGGF